MEDIKAKIRMIVDKGKKEDMEELSDMLEDSLMYIYKTAPEMFEEMDCSLNEMAYGKILTPEMAHTWVNMMKPYGEHWSMEDTNSVLKKNDFEYNEAEFYAVLNMMYNDYKKTIDDDTTEYIKLARDWFEDEDGNPAKTYNYYKYVVKGD